MVVSNWLSEWYRSSNMLMLPEVSDTHQVDSVVVCNRLVVYDDYSNIIVLLFCLSS